MKRIGITGGIGSGKSAVAKWLRDNGFAVYDTDSNAKRLMNESAEIRNALTEKFGAEIYTPEGLDNKLLAAKIFGDESALRFVNGVVHPVVISDFMSWSYSQEGKVVFVESAILYDCALKDIVDGVIYVDALEELRIARAMLRDGAKRSDVEKRVRAQKKPVDVKPDWVIDNSCDMDKLYDQVKALTIKEGWIEGENVVEVEKPVVQKKHGFWWWTGHTILVLWALSVLWVVVLKWVPVWFTPLMIKRCVEAKLEGREARIERTWVPLEDISPYYFRACLASEDNKFPTHYGFSEKGIKQAWESNKKGKKLRGGSTISQQTAKNVFTWCTRTWVRKGFETYFTVMIELIWGKERIMEVYCNVAEMGDGVYGVEAAAQKNFHRSAKKLNASQAALIVAALPNPRVYSISHPGPYMRKRQGKIMWLMPKVRKFPEDKK